MTMEIEHHPAATTPPTSPREPRETELLLQFLHERDHDCPRCGYNLRNLTQPVCPECRESLILKIGIQRVRLLWLLLALAPSIFCAIAVGLGVVMSILHGPPPADLEAVLVILFLMFSGSLGVILGIRHTWFLRLSDSAQIGIAVATWAVHLTVFLYMALFA